MKQDRFGIGFRPELAAAIVSNLDRIDVVEVIAETLFDVGARRLRATRTLGRMVPLSLHGVSLGMASAQRLDERRLGKLARIRDAVLPERLSEHLAFVRGAGVEIGHLAAPPRTAATVEGTARNAARARQVLGEAVALENVATLIEPPQIGFDEASWLSTTLSAADSGMLLDLHNLYANARNFGLDAHALLRRLPLQRVELVHIAGGRASRCPGAETERWLDDHLNPVPDPVYSLLQDLGTLAPQPLTVILERDGAYPPFRELLAELVAAREALARGRNGEAARLDSPGIVRRVA